MCISCFQLTDFSALTNEWIRNPWDPAWLKSFYFFFIHSSDTGPGRTHECCNMLQISMVLTLSCSCASVNLLILPLHLTLRNIDVNIQPDFNSRESYRQLSGEDQAIMVWLRTGAIRLWCHTLTKSCARESSMCHCGLSPMMVEHFLQDCQTHQKLRAEPWPADTHQQTKFLLSASGGSPVREKKYSLVKNLKHTEKCMSELPEFLSEWTAKKKKHVFMTSIFRSFHCLTTQVWNFNTLSTSNISDNQHNQNSCHNCLQGLSSQVLVSPCFCFFRTWSERKAWSFHTECIPWVRHIWRHFKTSAWVVPTRLGVGGREL